MTPLLACFPVCMTFVAIGIVGAVVVALGMYNRTPLNAPPGGETEPSRYDTTGPPPWWFLPVVFAVLTVVMLVLAWYWPE